MRDDAPMDSAADRSSRPARVLRPDESGGASMRIQSDAGLAAFARAVARLDAPVPASPLAAGGDDAFRVPPVPPGTPGRTTQASND